jgi:hypothetical protein
MHSERYENIYRHHQSKNTSFSLHGTHGKPELKPKSSLLHAYQFRHFRNISLTIKAKYNLSYLLID